MFDKLRFQVRWWWEARRMRRHIRKGFHSGAITKDVLATESQAVEGAVMIFTLMRMAFLAMPRADRERIREEARKRREGKI